MKSEESRSTTTSHRGVEDLKTSPKFVKKQLPVYPVTPRVRIGRNDACPCRSGKKYKKCCLNRASII